MAGSVRTKQRLSDAVAQALQEDILGLTTGDRLPTEAELVERFGVSRTVVREATRLWSSAAWRPSAQAAE